MEAEVVSRQKVLAGGPFVLSLGVSRIPRLKAPHLSSFQLLASTILCFPVSGNLLASYPQYLRTGRSIQSQVYLDKILLPSYTSLANVHPS